MSIKTTPNPVIQRKLGKGVNTRKDQTQPKRQKDIKVKQDVSPDLADLGPVSYYTTETEGEFLRQMFDFLESINIKTGRKIYYSVPRRIWNVVIALIAGMVLIWALYTLVTFALDRLAWESRPSVYDRLAGPYTIDMRSTPTLDLNIETGILPATVQSFNHRSLVADANGALSEFANVTTRVYPADTASFDAVMRGSMMVDNLLGQCLLSAAGATTSDCGIVTFARYAEAGIYTSSSDTVTVVAAQYANNEQAAQGFTHLYDISRLVGIIGNYAMVESRTVDYFYSSTRNNFYFTWTNGTWVYTVNSTSLTVLDSFMSEFPF